MVYIWLRVHNLRQISGNFEQHETLVHLLIRVGRKHQCHFQRFKVAGYSSKCEQFYRLGCCLIKHKLVILKCIWSNVRKNVFTSLHTFPCVKLQEWGVHTEAKPRRTCTFVYARGRNRSSEESSWQSHQIRKYAYPNSVQNDGMVSGNSNATLQNSISAQVSQFQCAQDIHATSCFLDLSCLRRFLSDKEEIITGEDDVVDLVMYWLTKFSLSCCFWIGYGSTRRCMWGSQGKCKDATSGNGQGSKPNKWPSMGGSETVKMGQWRQCSQGGQLQ